MPQDQNRLNKPIKIDEKDVVANKQLQSSIPGVRNLLSVMELSLAQYSVNPICKIRYRHQRAAELFHVNPRFADIPKSIVRSDAMYSIPWWNSKEVIHEDNTNNPVDIKRLDEAKLVDEKRFKIQLLDGRNVVQLRKVLISKSGKRFKEFEVVYPDGAKADFSSIPNRILPLYGINNDLISREELIIICEGVKACEALIKRNIVAVGTLTGALGTPSKEALKPLIKKKGVIYVWPDNDDVGVQHMERIAQRLNNLGAEDIRVIRWHGAPRKADAANYVRDKKSILQLIKEAKKWEPSLEPRHRGIMAISHSSFSLQLRLTNDERPSVPRIE